MIRKATNNVKEMLRKRYLSNFAKYLSVHQNETHFFPVLRPDHEQYFQRCFRFHAGLHDVEPAPGPQDCLNIGKGQDDIKRKIAISKEANNDWRGKYCPQKRYEICRTRTRREERLKRCRERCTKLSYCLTCTVKRVPKKEGNPNYKNSQDELDSFLKAVTTLWD